MFLTSLSFVVVIKFMGCVRQNHQATAIPKFGAWDVTDPKSGEGYTTIFSKVKEQRHIPSSHISSINNPPFNDYSNINKNQHDGPSSGLSKVMLYNVAS